MGWTTGVVSSAPALNVMMERVTEILGAQDLCVLGTVGQHGVQLTPCFFAPLSEHRLVFISSKNAGHVANLRIDPRCSALVLPDQAEQGKLVSLQLSGTVSRPKGVGRLRALRTYMTRMSRRIPSAVNGMHGLLDKEVFVLETMSIGLLDTGLHRGIMRLEKIRSGDTSAEAA